MSSLSTCLGAYKQFSREVMLQKPTVYGSYSHSFCVDYLVSTTWVDFPNNIRVVPFRDELAPCRMCHDDRSSYSEHLIPNLEWAKANLFVECSWQACLITLQLLLCLFSSRDSISARQSLWLSSSLKPSSMATRSNGIWISKGKIASTPYTRA